MGTIFQKECIRYDKYLVEYLGDTKVNAAYIGKYPHRTIGLDLPEGEKDYVCVLIDGEWREFDGN